MHPDELKELENLSIEEKYQKLRSQCDYLSRLNLELYQENLMLKVQLNEHTRVNAKEDQTVLGSECEKEEVN